MGRKSRNKRQRSIRQVEPASTTLKVVAFICLTIGLSSFWGIAQFHHIDNTRNGVGFFFLFAVLGLLLCIPFYILIYKTIPDLKQDKRVSKQWTSNLFGLGMGFFFLTPAIASYINRTHLVGSNDCKEYKIIRKGSSGGRYHEYYLFVQIDNDEERLTIFKPLWETFNERQGIRLCLEKGILGFDYIKIDK
ncbi:MAG: hypothetical protein U0V75_02735 [Ferruginibacter sp.]